MDFESILGVPFFIVVLTPSCCVSGKQDCMYADGFGDLTGIFFDYIFTYVHMYSYFLSM